MSEQIANSLATEIEAFETAWKTAKLNVRYLKKKGIMDAEVPDELRIARGVWYKDAKHRLRHAAKVAMYKTHILELFREWKVKSDTLAQVQKYSDIKDQITDPNLRQFLQAINELEAEGRVVIEREGGTAHEVARDIVKEKFSEMHQKTMIDRTKYTANTPSHGFGGAVCPTCRIAVSSSDNSRETVNK